jgi:hypothetical protein
VDACLCGWVEVLGDNCNGMVVLVEKSNRDMPAEETGFKAMLFSAENLNLLMKRN